MKEKIVSILKLLFCFGLFMYSSSFVRIILEHFEIDVNNLSVLNNVLINLIISFILCIVTTLIYRKDLMKDFKEFKYNWKSKLLFALKIFGIFMLIKFIGSYISIILSEIFNIEQITSDNQNTINVMLKQFPLLVTLSAVLLAPYYEEILFRLAFKKCIQNKKLFILVSGLIFGLIHIFPTDLHLGVALIQSIPYVTMGICLAYYYQKYNNICYSMLVHFYNNLISIIFIILSYFINLI